jgi:hypothetical protein
MNTHRTVWILGSGFSKPLGGPLLGELISAHAVNTVQIRHAVNCSASYNAYILGAKNGAWSDVESFLDTIDLARRQLREIGKNPIQVPYSVSKVIAGTEIKPANMQVVLERLEQIYEDAVRLVAFQCNDFVEQGNIDSELWLPFKNWAQTLKNDSYHTIVSFNYDCVLEKLGFIESPSPNMTSSESRVIKLHGCIKWTRREQDNVERYEVHPLAAESISGYIKGCNPSQVGIATPGITKRERVIGPLLNLWKIAKEEISRANSIVFVGYRFPPTDSQSLIEIFNAIKENSQNQVNVHIVLGPVVNDSAIIRLKALIEYAMLNSERKSRKDESSQFKSYRLIVHPLWSQDFLSLWSPVLTAN